MTDVDAHAKLAAVPSRGSGGVAEAPSNKELDGVDPKQAVDLKRMSSRMWVPVGAIPTAVGVAVVGAVRHRL